MSYEHHERYEDKPKIFDGFDGLFSMYNRKAKIDDEKMTESWKSDSDGILVFTGLASAAVAQLLSGSLQSLQSSSQDVSSFYLARIYQLTPGSNASSITLPPDPSQFRTPRSAVWVNALWSLSLVISLTCALLATLFQQWARRYMRITQNADDPQSRARIREFMRQGSTWLRLMHELLNGLLHLAVFLFLIGFDIYLFTINRLVAVTVAVCVGACAVPYLWITFAPLIFRTPYYTPLSSLVWIISMGVIWLGLQLCLGLQQLRDSDSVSTIWRSLHKCCQRIKRGITKEVEAMARTRSANLDMDVFMRTFNTLDDDDDMDEFLAGIPGFYSSANVKRDPHTLAWLNFEQLPDSVLSFLCRSLSSNLLSKSTKDARIMNCLKAIKSDPLLLQCTFGRALSSVDSIVFECHPFVVLAHAQVTNVDRIADMHASHFADLYAVPYADPGIKDYARCIMAVAINRIYYDYDHGSVFSKDYLGLTDEELEQQAGFVRLHNLIHLIRQLRASQLNTREQFTPGTVWHNSLTQACELDVADAAQGSRNEFCALWNELAQGLEQAVGTERLNTIHILSVIRNVFIPLHGGVDFLPVEYHTPRGDYHLLESARFYHPCDVANHQ